MPAPLLVPCGDSARLQIGLREGRMQLQYRAPGLDRPGQKIFIALDALPGIGSAVVPYGRNEEGSTVFLPFNADRIYTVTLRDGEPMLAMRTWRGTEWSSPTDASHEMSATYSADQCSMEINLHGLGKRTRFGLEVYAKDLSANDGWGRLYGAADGLSHSGPGDQYLPAYQEVTFGGGFAAHRRTRLETPERVRIYQLFVRLFGNTNETRKINGSLAENGVGKFNDINDTALTAIRDLGCTHVWLTGILQQATAAHYPEIGEPADDPDLLKGLAGSPYAVKDYFDVCPDYAVDPARRLEDFAALLTRLHAHGLRAIIDLIPNHVARSYRSNIRPELSFGTHDDRSVFFDPKNNFFYLRPGDPGGGPPLRLPTFRDGHPISPTCQVLGTCKGEFLPEKEFGRVTGNDVVSWSPSINDWYETVKLNYGVDFTRPTMRAFPHAHEPELPIPDTWQKMDEIIAYWQTMGVDGFRCDMSHMIPPEFWAWVIGRARTRHPDVWFMGEAYNDDPNKLPSANPVIASLHNVMFDLLNAGFNAVYDDPSYKGLKYIYDGPRWANDLDRALAPDFIFHNSLRYPENHDEVRLAGKQQWGGIGMEVGRPVAAILYGIGRGPLMIYNGQEVGEPAHGVEGFGGDDARTTIFDYWSMPEFVKWVADHRYDGSRLSPGQVSLRDYYKRLFQLAGEPGFRFGGLYPLNSANVNTPRFGVVDGDPASGHWMYAFLRYDPHGGQRWLVLANLHHSQSFTDLHLRIPAEALIWLGLSEGESIDFADRLHGTFSVRAEAEQLPHPGLPLGDVPPLSALYLELTRIFQPGSKKIAKSSR